MERIRAIAGDTAVLVPTVVMTGTATANIEDELRFESQDYLVGLLDVLGFKKHVRNAMRNRSSDRLGPTLQKLWLDLPAFLLGEESPFFRKCESGGINPRSPDPLILGELIRNRIQFSDTIIFYVRGGKKDQVGYENKLHSLCCIMNSFIQLSILKPGKSTVPLAFRGAVAFGPAVIEPESGIYYGMSLLDAYELAEGQNWLGGAVHATVGVRSLLNKVGNRHLEGFDGQLLEYDGIPVDKTDHPNVEFALNWVQMHPACKEYFKGIAFRKPLKEDIIEGNLRYYEWGQGPKEQKKKKSTNAFAEQVCKAYATSPSHRDRWSTEA